MSVYTLNVNDAGVLNGYTKRCRYLCLQVGDLATEWPGGSMQATQSGALRVEDYDRTSRGDSGDVWTRTRELARFRGRFVWSIFVASLSIYFGLLVVMLSMRDLMSVRLHGDVNLGLAAVCAQLLVTVATFWAYCAWASTHFDGRARELSDAASLAENSWETQ